MAGPPSPPSRRAGSIYAWTWRLPMIVWQGLFFVGPLVFMIAMSFFIVKNYRMEPAFVLDNWANMLSRPFFWSAYGLTFQLAVITTIAASVIAFPASYLLGIKASETVRRWAIFLLIVPFFTSYLVRTYSWQVLLAENGVLNGIFRLVGIGTITMLNTKFASVVGYLTLCLPLVVILQTVTLANVDKRLIEAAYNLGAGKLYTVFQVIIPAAKAGLVIAAVFTFILSFGDFVAPYYLGGSKPPTLSILIVDTVKSGQQWPRSAVVAITMILTLLIVAFAAVGFAYRKRA